MTTQTEPRQDERRRLRDRIPVVLHETAFRRYWTAQTVSFVGDQVTMVALPLIGVLALHASAAQMGFLWTVESLPSLLFSLHAGAWVDRRGRRRTTMILTDLGRMLILATVPVAYFLGALSMPHLYVVAFAAGTLAVLFNVCASSLFPAIVSREHFLPANALSKGSYSFSWVAGPSIGGVLVQLLSAPFAILVDVGSFLASALLLRGISVQEPATDPEETGGVLDGLKFILRTGALRSKFTAGTSLNFFYAIYFTLQLLFAARVLHMTAAMVGLALSGGAVGAMIGSGIASRTSRRIGLGATFLVGSFVFPAALVLVPLAGGDHWLGFGMFLAAEFVSSIGLMMFDITGATLQQAITPDRFRSRVQGAYMAVNYGIRPVGSLVAGGLGTWIGLRPTMWVAVLGGAASVLLLLGSPIVRMRELPDEAG